MIGMIRETERCAGVPHDSKRRRRAATARAVNVVRHGRAIYRSPDRIIHPIRNPVHGGPPMVGDFRKFIARGNVLDLAVGIVIGAAFTTVVKSFVDDILMPPIGRLTGGVDFSNLFMPLDGKHYGSLEAAKAAGAATVNYGLFINNVIAFLIVAFAVFLVVKAYERALPPEAPPATQKDCPFCAEKVSLAAVRCPHCTSELTPVPVLAV
jgi:large conductance mechanosensitive channel